MTTTSVCPARTLVATEALLRLQDNLVDVVAVKAMMCVHGDAGLGKMLSVNASLRALAPADVCRVQFRARPTPRDSTGHSARPVRCFGRDWEPADASHRIRRVAERCSSRTVPRSCVR